jgi:nicotinate-nucleotide pyrophosphorylase (carboxylating)
MPDKFYNNYKNEIESFIDQALAEDIGVGDHSSLSCIDSSKKNTAQLIIKDKGHIAGITLARLIFRRYDSDLNL